MTPKKQKIYIAIIVLCMLGTAGILYYGFGTGSVSNEVPLELTTPRPTPTPNGGAATANSQGIKIYSAPKVFPDDTNFDWTVLDSSTFKTLTGIPNLTLDPNQMGKDNIFTP